MKAALIIIGNEILSGRTQDKNLSYLANWLNEIGIQLSEVRVIRDEEDIIIETVNYLRKTYNYVFTTGGIGPTHDDITSLSIARAFNVDLEINDKALSILKEYYKDSELTDSRMKMTMIPKGAELVDNPVSKGPIFFPAPTSPNSLEAILAECNPGIISILAGLDNLLNG